MTIIVIILALLCIYKIEIADKGHFFPDYISKEKTIAVEGVFVVLVFIRHFFRYDFPVGQYDGFAQTLDSSSTQLIVTLFLFYSGFGVMESIRRKGYKLYTKTLPSKAIKLLLRFDVAIILFLLVNAYFGKTYSIKQILMSLICWESVGNSNWYVLIIIVLYLISWISFSVFKKNIILAISLVTGLSVMVVFLIRIAKMEFWYNTIICYPLGMWYSLLRSSFYTNKKQKESNITRNNVLYIFVLFCTVLLYALTYSHRADTLWTYYAWSCMFVCIVILITMKVSFNNAFLQLMGKHVFSIYILQRIPMIILQKAGYLTNHPYLSFVISFVATVFIAIIFDYVMQQIDQTWNKKVKTKFSSGEKSDDNIQPVSSINNTKPVSVILLLCLTIVVILISPMICSGDRTVTITALAEKNDSSLMSDIFLKRIKMNNQKISILQPSSGNWVWYKDHYCWLENSESRIKETITNDITMHLSLQNNTQLIFSGNKWKGKLVVKADEWEKKVDTYVDDGDWNDIVVTLPDPTVEQIVKHAILPGICFIALMLICGLLSSAFSFDIKRKHL